MGHLTLACLTFAQTLSQKPNAVEEESLVSPWIMLIIVVLLLGLPFLLGSVIARALKMKEQSLKIGVVLLAFLLGMSKIAWQYVAGYFQQRQYQQQLETWNEREQKREQISQKDIDSLKAAHPKMLIQFERQKQTKSE